MTKAEVLGGPVWAHIRYQQSFVHWRRGNYKAAHHAALEALRLFNEGLIWQNQQADIVNLTRMRRILAGDLVELGRIHALLGLIATSAGHHTQALNYLKPALELYEQCKSQREIAIVCCNLGDAYLRKAEHGLAEAFFHRSLSIAEQTGEIPLVCLNLGNLGVLASRSGNLVKAEAWLRRGITLLEHGNASVFYVILCHSSLATVLQEQDKLPEASANIYHALSLARHLHLAPYTGFVFVTPGGMRLAQAIDIESSEESADLSNSESTRILKRAKKTLQHALAIEELETETRVEGQVYLAQATLLLGEEEGARQVAIQSLEQANQHELTWLVVRVQHLLGCIMDALGLSAEATRHFEQALHISQKSGMHLEYAYTLCQYELIFLQRNESGEEQYQRGLTYQREARSLFIENHAQFHLRLVERALAGYTDTFSTELMA